MKSRIDKRTIVVLLPVVVAIAFSCKNKPVPKHSAHQHQHAERGDKIKVTQVDLNTTLTPANTFVISSIPVTTAHFSKQKIEIPALGSIAYNTKQAGTISARFSGRIEKLYVRYRFQKVEKGQKIMEIYSPELMTAQQNLLFVLKNDPSNASLIDAAKQRLFLMGLNDKQVNVLIKSKKPSLFVPVYSKYTGHIHETPGSAMTVSTATMKEPALRTEELSLKEGMYVQKGQTLFEVFDPNRVWAVLNIYAETQFLVKAGNPVIIIPETGPDKQFRSKISFIEPFFRDNSKTVTARVDFNNYQKQIPIGSQVKAIITVEQVNAKWIPLSAIVSLGVDKIVFIKQQNGFKAKKVVTGLAYQNNIQVVSGLGTTDSIAENGQYLIDSESFIKINQQAVCKKETIKGNKTASCNNINI